jgi:hypothetical protein
MHEFNAFIDTACVNNSVFMNNGGVVKVACILALSPDFWDVLIGPHSEVNSFAPLVKKSHIVFLNAVL